jgi:hypothetical protein
MLAAVYPKTTKARKTRGARDFGLMDSQAKATRSTATTPPLDNKNQKRLAALNAASV